MTTLPVWWVPPLMLLKSKLTKTPVSGRPFETVPVVRLKDLDALREGLELLAAGIECQGPSCFWCDTHEGHPLSATAKEAQRLLALLPKREQRS